MVSAILLAAGQSRRMGQDKLSLPWGNETVLGHSLGVLLKSDVREVIVVLRDHHGASRFHSLPSKIALGVAERLKIVNNPYYKRGMSTSIRRGLQAIDPSTQGILIALGDQPLIKARTINALIHAFDRRSGAIVVPSFRGEKGHPVIFDRRYFHELLRLKGDAGGRSVVERHPGEVRLVRVRSEGVTKDIDTWKDYRKMVHQDE